NVYHDLDGYWAVKDGWRRAGWGDFRQKTSEAPRGASRVVLSWPWAAPARSDEQKAPSLVALLERREFDRALQLNPQMAALHKASRPAEFVGVETVLGKRLEVLADKTKIPPPPPRVLLVEEGARPDEYNGVSPPLHLAVESAKPGDVILIRHDGKDGRLAVKPIHLHGRDASDLTIR